MPAYGVQITPQLGNVPARPWTSSTPRKKKGSGGGGDDAEDEDEDVGGSGVPTRRRLFG